jgi:5'-methylthioadenosine phosphorylase
LSAEQVQTPFGPTSVRTVDFDAQRAVVIRTIWTGRQDGKAIRAMVYGAKLLGVDRIVEIVEARPLDRLLPGAGFAVPHDLVDLTNGQYLTFFQGKGYGFLPQQTPFCPELRAALVPTARTAYPSSAGRGIVAALDGWEQIDQARSWGAHLAAPGISPTAFLARELELCYVPLCVLGSDHGLIGSVLQQMLEKLGIGRSCPCATAMQATRQRGLIGDDWREWL